ncbi:NAD-dependent epimerase/dehydratase family protein [Paracoccaceae bacterium]|nr:NAD-dependent epimerase/dehydratase family protein [Paracoccaceae bacterium]
MKVLITGGLGQIGSHVAELCLERGDEVLCIDNLETGRVEHLSTHENLKIEILSISDRERLETCFQAFQPDAVVHTAASYKDPNDWYSDTMTNCVGGANVVDLSTKYGVKRFVYFQTALCYGLKPDQSPISLSHPRRPEGSSYAISKTTNELYLELSGLEYVTFRLANVVGPRNVAGPLPIFYQRLKDGKKCFVTEARRDFVYVGDLARAVVQACDGKGSGTYHFSSGKDVAIIDLYNQVTKSMGFNEPPEVEIKPLGSDDVASILLDPSRTFEDFGPIEFTPIDKTVSTAIEYYKEHGTLGEYTHLKLEKSK